jgi:hypothetical protein
MLTMAIERPAIAARIVRIELSRSAPIWTVWHRGDGEAVRRALYVACHARELREGLDDLASAAFVALPGATIRELGLLLRRKGA